MYSSAKEFRDSYSKKSYLQQCDETVKQRWRKQALKLVKNPQIIEDFDIIEEEVVSHHQETKPRKTKRKKSAVKEKRDKKTD